MSTLDGFKVPRNPHNERPYYASGTVAIKAGNVVTLDLTNTVAAQEAATPGESGIGVIVAGTTGYPIGVAIDDASLGQQLRVQDHGVIACLASGAITAGSIVTSGATGSVATSGLGGSFQLGQALTAAASAGDTILVQIRISNNA